MKFGKEEMQKLKQLSRIECSEEEEEALLKKLLSTFKQIETLSVIDTEGVPECYSVIEEVHTVLRDDEEGDLLEREKLLESSADQVGGMISVPPVIQF